MMLNVRLKLVQQVSTMFVGASKAQAVPQGTVLSPEQVMEMHGLVGQHCVSETLSMCAPPWVAPPLAKCGFPWNAMVTVDEVGTKLTQKFVQPAME